MTAGRTNLVIEKGATYERIVRYLDSELNPIDITSYSPRMQIRNTVNSPTVVLDLNTTNGYITVTDALNGEITINIPFSITETLPAMLAVYDLELYNGDVIRLMEGQVEIREEITR